MTVTPPKQIGVRRVNVIGKLLPYRDGQPAMIRMENSLFWYVPLFDNEDQLKGFSEFCDMEWDSIKMVTGDDFLDSFRGTDIRPITNIRMEDGRVRWTQFPMDGEDLC